MYTTQGNESGGFDSGDVAITSSYTQVATLQVSGKSAIGFRLKNTGGVNALTNLKLTRSMVLGAHANALHGGTGELEDWIVDAAFATPTTELLPVIGGTINTLAAGAAGQVHLNVVDGVAEIGIWAKSTGTTLRVQGNMARRTSAGS